MDRRRLAALAGYHGDSDTVHALFRDPDPGVRAIALGALARLGNLDDSSLAAALSDTDRAVRRRACDLAGTNQSGSTVAALQRSLSDTDPLVAEAAAAAIGEHGPEASPALDALTAMASGHKDALCREAAVAALGAIGDKRGLDTVLAALDDKPAIRRRAAVALAAFDDPSAEVGLRKCLEDRDWQVRQVAEELLRAD